MDYKEAINKILQNIISFKLEENFKMFKIFVNSTSITKLNLSLANELINIKNSRDNFFSFSISINNNDDIIYNENLNKFVNEVNNYISNTSSIDNVLLKIEISKIPGNSTLSIYDLETFSDYLYKLKLSQIICNFNELRNENKYIYFEIQNINPNFISCTNIICFKSINGIFEKTFETNIEVIKRRKTICNLLNDESFDFEPDNFMLSESVSEKIDNIFNRLKIVYSLISIFDVSNIKGNILNLKINGYKNSCFDIDFNNIDITKTISYYDIYKWIYGNDGTISDKAGIARNIISLYLIKSSDICIDSTALSAIKSNYNIYLKKNIEKYLDLKSKVTETLFSINKSINEIYSTITENFLKNIGLFGTFVITAIIMNSFSEKRLSNIFTRDITYISLFLVLVSIVFLVYTIKEVNYKIKNLITTYYRLKIGYKDLLVRKDINDLFNKDRYLKKDLKYIKYKVKIYSFLWIIVTIGFLIVIIFLGLPNIIFVVESIIAKLGKLLLK